MSDTKTDDSSPGLLDGRPPWMRAGLISMTRAAAIIVFLVAISAITGEESLVNGGTAGATVRLMVPILLAAMGGIFAERAGIVNIGLEGMMVMGTWFGAYFGFAEFEFLGVPFGGNAYWGLIFSMLGGALGGLLLGISTVTFGVDHVVAGVAVNLIAPGAPAIFGTWPFVSDLRTGAMSGGSGEQGLLMAACAQMGRYYDLPTGVASGN